MDMHFIFTKIMAFFPIFLFSICFHEFAHGLVAKWRGDRTAELSGRLTLNPFAHADLLGTIIFPMIGVATGFFFGWAKPVPVNERNLKDPKKDMFWIALAGPASNILLATLMAFVVGFVMKYLALASFHQTFMDLSQIFILTNLTLAVFNALPLHPLDGGKIMARFIPDSVNLWLEEHQLILFIGLIILLQTRMSGVLIAPIRFLFNVLMTFSGALWSIF